MCDICKELIACPVGEKRRIMIEEPERGSVHHGPYSTFTDAYGKNFKCEGPLFIIDKYPDHTDCFIMQDIWNEDSVHYGFGVDNIRFCLFCGEELVKEN